MFEESYFSSSLSDSASWLEKHKEWELKWREAWDAECKKRDNNLCTIERTNAAPPKLPPSLDGMLKDFEDGKVSPVPPRFTPLSDTECFYTPL